MTIDLKKKAGSMQPYWSRWTLSFNRQMHCDATGMYEKSSQSTCDKQLIMNKLVFKMDVF